MTTTTEIDYAETVATLRRLDRSARRYRQAADRNPEAGSLAALLAVCTATIREAFDKGASFDEVAAAVGIRKEEDR